MSEVAFDRIEQGMQFAELRAAVLAADAVNAHSPGFAPQDLEQVPAEYSAGRRFAVVTRELETAGPSANLQYTMGAVAKNALTYRALASQERAMLREFRTVAEESRK